MQPYLANTQKHIDNSPPVLSNEIPNDTLSGLCCYLAGKTAAAVRVGTIPCSAGYPAFAWLAFLDADIAPQP